MKKFGSIEVNKQYYPRPSVYGIYQRNSGEIALIEKSGNYYLPGGGKNENETAEECLKRECLEELGWIITIGNRLESTINHIYIDQNQNGYKIIGEFYKIMKFDSIHHPLEKNHQLVWKSAKEAMTLLIDQAQQYIIRNYYCKNKR